MPTLIRLIVALLFLCGLGYAGLFALTVLVDPGEKLITVRIPQRDLLAKSRPNAMPMPNLTSDTPANPSSAAPQPSMTSADTAPIAPGANADTPE